MRIEYGWLLAGLILGYLFYYFQEIASEKIKAWYWKRKEAQRRPRMNFYKYNIGNSAFYGSVLVAIIGIKAERTSTGEVNIYYIIKGGTNELQVPESELSDKPKGRILND